MAMSTTTTTTAPCMSHYNRDIIPKIKPTTIICPCSKSTTYFLRHENRRSITITTTTNFGKFTVRSSDETAETWEGGSVEVAKGPPSLISVLNVEKALRGIAITDVDHYGRLGLQRGCSYELVRATYQTKVKEVSTQGLDEEELKEELDRLQESYRILSTEEERRLYDWSLARSDSPDRYTWPFERDLTQVEVKGTPPAQEPENIGPTTVVGYFFLGWIVLAFALSIILNQV